MRNYEDLNVWKKAYQISLEIYAITKKFPKEEQFGLISQIRRAATSVTINIAEGCGYDSNKEFVRFLRIASGSITEVSCILRLSKDLEYISEDEFELLHKEVQTIRKMLFSLRKSQVK